MEIYGYSNEDSQKLMKLKEVSISTNPETLREISAFLLECANEIELYKKEWNHEHFTSSKNTKTTPDLIICNQDAV